MKIERQDKLMSKMQNYTKVIVQHDLFRNKPKQLELLDKVKNTIELTLADPAECNILFFKGLNIHFYNNGYVIESEGSRVEHDKIISVIGDMIDGMSIVAA